VPQRRSWVSALVAQVCDYVFEEVDEPLEVQPVELEPHPVIAVVSASPRSGATTVARMLAAELASRSDGAAIVTSPVAVRRATPPSRAAAKLATALSGVAGVVPCGRLCIVSGSLADVAAAARYRAPVVLDLPADGSAAGVATIAQRAVVVAAGSGEPALLDAVASVIGGDPVKVANRVTDPGEWGSRAAVLLPDSRVAARAAALGTRALGPLGTGISALADALEARR
jgi:hypothetical protein